MSDYSNSEIPNGSYYADVAVLAEIFAKRYGTSVNAAYEWLTKDVEVPSADVQPVVQWIPCSEHLPNKEGIYIVTDDAGGMATVSTDEFSHYEDGEPMWMFSQNVTAWMPLPEPYQEGADE